MKRSPKPASGQFTLALRREPSPPLDKPRKEELLKVLTELLLEALGVRVGREPRRKGAAAMNPKITPEHLHRGAIVYVRQSTIGQVLEHTESKRRQYALADSARQLGFVSVSIIDDDLGRSGSGLVERPGFQKLVAAVCGGSVGAVFCLEASRLARNGRDWHHLIDLCALVNTLVIDH